MGVKLDNCQRGMGTLPVVGGRDRVVVPENEHHDRRRHRRISVQLPAVYRSNALTLDGQVSNLSQGGLFIRTECKELIGTEAEIRIHFPDTSNPLVISGRVAWAYPEVGLGICFDKLSRGARVAVANYLLHFTQYLI
jgi:Tfp pilus assembly protein PilZ